MKKKNNKNISSTASVIIALVIVALVAVLLHSGNIAIDFKDTSVEIKVPCWFDSDISYSEIDTVTYRNDLDVGGRTIGVGTARLSVGTFQNKEFGSYTLYAYTGAKEFIVLTSDNKTIVIGMSNAKDTQTVYGTILERMGEK